MIRFCFKKFTWRHRYLAAWVILFAAAMWFASSFELYRAPYRRTILCTAIIVFILLIFAAFFLSKRKFKNYKMKIAVILIVSYAAAVCFGIIYPIVYCDIRYGNIVLHEGKTAEVYGSVANEPSVSSGGSSVGFKVRTSRIMSELGESEKPAYIMVYIPAKSELSKTVKEGDAVRFTAALSRPVKKIDNFNYRNHLMSSGCAVMARTADCGLYETDKDTERKFLHLGKAVRERVKEYAGDILSDGDERALLEGILLGIKDGFSNELMDDMSNSGLMHIAAVSGLHIMFLSGVLAFVLRGFKPKCRSIIMIIVLFAFAYIADFTPSVSRAVIMVSVILLGNMLMRDADAITSLFFAAFVLLLCNPYIMYSASFLLSFSATLSILIYLQPMSLWAKLAANKFTDKISSVRLKDSLKRVILYLSEAVIVPLSCQILVCPISASIFGKISLAAILLNIIVIPCTMIIFVAGLFNFVLYLAAPAAAKFVGSVLLHFPLALVRLCAGKSAALPLKIIPAQSPGIITFAVYAFLCAALYYALAFYGEKRLNKRTEKIS